MGTGTSRHFRDKLDFITRCVETSGSIDPLRSSKVILSRRPSRILGGNYENLSAQPVSVDLITTGSVFRVVSTRHSRTDDEG